MTGQGGNPAKAGMPPGPPKDWRKRRTSNSVPSRESRSRFRWYLGRGSEHLHSVSDGNGMPPENSGLRTRRLAKVAAGIPFVLSFVLLAGLAGCVSPVEPVLGSAQGFAPSTQQASDIPLSVADDAAIPGTDAVPAAQEAAGAAMDQPAAAAVAAIGSVAVPAPAPRDASTLTAEGTALAFVNEPAQGSVGVDAALAAGSNVTGSVAATGTGRATAKPQSLYAMLKQRQAERDAAFARNVTSGTSKPQQAPLQQAAVALPGVNPNAATPFELLPGRGRADQFPGHEDAEDEDGFEPYEVASAGSLARLSPNGILRQSEKVEVGCFDPALTSLLKAVEAHYGRPVLVTSGYRDPRSNRRAGGASHSMHIQCKAADIQVAGVSKWDLAKYLRTIQGRGGVGTYCRTNSVHIDVGPEREWHHPCRRAKKRA
jgi:uncharacterized protein YcbK (DUF882 family)